MDNTAIALKQLKQHGYRVTKQRESMVDYLGRNQHRYTAVTILDRYMRTQFPGVSHDTIYRNVKSFIEMGIVESRMEDDQIVVKLQCDFQHPHHHHFICTNCGKVIEFSDDSIELRQREIASRHGIRLTNHSLYLYGHCAEGDCREDEHAHDAVEK